METDKHTPGFAGLGRLFWMVIGPGLLAITAMHIYLNGTGWHTVADYVYFAILVLMILGRWLEYLGGVPLNSFGEPSTPRDFRQYIVLLTIAGIAIWVVANAFGNHGRG